MELYLESVVRDLLGVSETLMRKTRQEVVDGLAEDPCQTVVINGRTHVAYPRETVRLIIETLEGHNKRENGKNTPCDTLGADELNKALVRGITSEIRGDLDGGEKTAPVRADMVTLQVKRITSNRFYMEAYNPVGDDLEPVTLRVGDTSRFVLFDSDGCPFEVPGCRKVDEGLYCYEGRLPRGRGRW